MPNLEKQFKEYFEKLKLTTSKKDLLRDSRENAEKTINAHFKGKLKKKVPSYCMQGSFKLYTVVNPLEDGEYDLDDGVYLNCLAGRREDWEDSETVHSWVDEPLEAITKDGVTDKNTCVRLNYKGDHHIDFPIYGIDGEEQFLAHKSLGWILSHPKDLHEWFIDQIGDNDQTKRLIHYIKGWKDCKQGTSKLPSGMILSILIVDNYVKDDEDQYSFLETCRAIYKKLEAHFCLERPVRPGENLLEGHSTTRKDAFLSKLNNLIEWGSQAIEKDSLVQASEEWRKVFGDRFPVAPEPKKASAPSIIGSHGKSA